MFLSVLMKEMEGKKEGEREGEGEEKRGSGTGREMKEEGRKEECKVLRLGKQREGIC